MRAWRRVAGWAAGEQCRVAGGLVGERLALERANGSWSDGRPIAKHRELSKRGTELLSIYLYSCSKQLFISLSLFRSKVFWLDL